MRKDIIVAARFAEVLVGPEYRKAKNATFEQSATPEQYAAKRQAAINIIINALRMPAYDNERNWEARRQAAMAELDGIELGSFNDYFQNQGGEATPNNLTIEDLENGEPEIVRTNARIIGLANVHEEPIDFIDGALRVIEDRKNVKNSIGPENYATTLKYFTDKYEEFPSSHLDKTILKEFIDECMQGFVDIAKKDKPNFVEMTNLYVAIRTLSAGSFDKKYSEDIIAHSLEQLPTYNVQTLSLVITAMGKLNLSETGESAATLIDLALRKRGTLERTVNMNQTMRAIANLPPSAAAERAFKTFLEMRNNLEQPQELEGLDAANYFLYITVKNVIANPELSLQAKELAERCARLGVQLLRRKESLGETTPHEIERLKVTLQRIIYNYNQI